MTKINQDEKGVFQPDAVNIFVLLIFVLGIAVLVYTVALS